MSRSQEDLHPIMRPYLGRLVAAANVRLGIDLDVIETARFDVEQAAAYASGHSQRPPGTSWHNVTYPLPCDCAGAKEGHPVLPHRKPAAMAFHVEPFPGRPILGYGDKALDWPTAVKVGVELRSSRLRPCTAPMMVLAAIGLLGEEVGLVWGGRWERLQDWHHFELHPNGATQAQVVAAMQADGDLHTILRFA